MKKLLYTILFCLITSTAFATDYYVDGGADGAGTSGDPMSVTQFNALSGDYGGDTFYFMPGAGNITAEVLVDGIYGNSGGQLVLDGYEVGDCDPINSTCSSSALLTAGMHILGGMDYITVKDFRMTGAKGLIVNYAGTSGVSDHLIIENNYMYETDGQLLYLSRNNSYVGSSYVVVRNNKTAHCGQNGNNPSQCVNLAYVTNGLFSGNYFLHDEDAYPSGCSSSNNIEIHALNQVLFEYNVVEGSPIQDVINIKEGGNGNHDIILRFNKVQNGPQDGLQIYGYPSFTDIYVYGNLFLANGYGGMLVGDHTDRIYVWSNIFNGNDRYGFIAQQNYESPPENIYVLNNTFFRNGLQNNPAYYGKTGISITKLTSLTVKNNLLMDNNPTAAQSYYHQFYRSSSSGGTLYLDYNTYYHSGETNMWRYNDAARNLAYMVGLGFEDADAGGTGGEVADAGFTNSDGADTTYETDDDDLTLTAAGTAGEDLTECFGIGLSNSDSWFETQTGYSTVTICIDDALDPSSDWTGNASTLSANISTLKRDTYGWTRGAYAFTAADETAPTISGASPSGEQTCTSNPRNVVVSANTDESATCRYSTNVAHAWADMAEMDSTGGTYHTQTENLACDANYTYYVLCQDASTNESDKETISFSIEAGTPPAPGSPGNFVGGSMAGGSM